MIRFGEAILLGNGLKRANNATWLSRINGEWCGCAGGGALLATGYDGVDGPEDVEAEMQKRWPWVNSLTLHALTHSYSEVLAGMLTLEQLVDRVNEWEPKAEAASPSYCEVVDEQAVTV